MITRADAEEILDAFGPLSILETTTTADELLEDIQVFDSPREYVEKMIVVEEDASDRMVTRTPAHNATHVAVDEVEFVKLIKDRCVALMGRKGW